MRLTEFRLPFKLKNPVLALGAQTKNTVCFARRNFAYISPVNNNLNDPRDFSLFTKGVNYFLKKSPKIIACDLHPDYQSTKYAFELSAKRYPLSAIQHHHAHIASCMAENGLKNQKIIGVAFDGTGLGSDNAIWGAEFLICDYKNFIRAAHLKEIPLLGGEAAIMEPWRVAAAWLYFTFTERFLNLKSDFLRRFPKEKWRILKKMCDSNFNSPLASSAGRLFDAVASLIFAKPQARFEAELAMELEKRAKRYTLSAKGYPFRIIQKNNTYILDPRPIFKGIVLDLQSKETKEKIAYRFHLAAAKMLQETCLKLRKEHRINSVILSGGVFQNKLLLRLASGLLYKEGFGVFTQQLLSCNDSGISLGQAIIAGYRGL